MSITINPIYMPANFVAQSIISKIILMRIPMQGGRSKRPWKTTLSVLSVNKDFTQHFFGTCLHPHTLTSHPSLFWGIAGENPCSC